MCPGREEGTDNSVTRVPARKGSKHEREVIETRYPQCEANEYKEPGEGFHKYQDNPDAYRDGIQAIVDYHQDDCMVTRAVKDWLHEGSFSHSEGIAKRGHIPYCRN